MKIFNRNIFAAATLSLGLLAAQTARADDAPPVAGPQIETLVVGKIKISKSLAESAAREGRDNQLQRVAEAMDTQFRAALSNTRKFKLVVGGDLGEILASQKRGQSGLYDTDHPDAPQVGKLRPPKYTVVPTIDDFQDVGETLRSEGHEPLASARRIRISVVATIYDINTGEIKETANVQVKDRKTTQESVDRAATGDAKDELLLILTRRAAEQSANRVVDVIFPAKIVSKMDKTITINRGDGTSVAVGQLWDAFALGEVIKDPDTGQVLGREEVPSGRVKITNVMPMFSKAVIIEDTGLDKGHILRLHEAKPTDPDGGPAKSDN